MGAAKLYGLRIDRVCSPCAAPLTHVLWGNDDIELARPANDEEYLGRAAPSVWGAARGQKNRSVASSPDATEERGRSLLAGRREM